MVLTTVFCLTIYLEGSC